MLMERMQLFFPKQLVDRVEEEAKKKGIKKGEMLRRIVDLYFEEKDKYPSK